MAIETEVKIQVDDETFNRVHNYLDKPKFYTQRNIVYMLGSTVMRYRDENGHTLFTLKGPRQDQEITKREEIESELTWKMFSSFDKAKQLMPGAFYYEKLRATTRIPYCIICFDILENGSKYIELEGEEDEIIRHRKNLGLQDFPIEKRNYQELLGWKK